MEIEIVQSSTGASLNMYKFLPKGKIRGIIQVSHGMVEHAGRYKRFAQKCVDAGYGVFAHDIRGHGRTVAKNSSLGVFGPVNGLGLVIEDINFVIEHLTEKHGNLPKICFGHSLGAMLALAYCVKYPSKVSALVCWNKQEAGLLAKLGQLILILEKQIRSPVKPSLVARKISYEAWNSKFRPNRTPNDWISQDQKEVDIYTADPLCGFDASISLWLDVLKGFFHTGKINVLKNLPRDLPIHIFGGKKDPSTNYGLDVKKFESKLRLIGMKDITCEVLPDTRHETLNELNRDEFISRFLKWLSVRF